MKNQTETVIASICAADETIKKADMLAALGHGVAVTPDGLIIDGVPAEDDYLMSDKHSPQFADPDGRENRLCLAQVGPLHYKVIATRDGANMAQFKQLVLDIAPDCVNAYILDGGGSTQLVFLGKKYNNANAQTNQAIRKLSDIVYFASAWYREGE